VYAVVRETPYDPDRLTRAVVSWTSFKGCTPHSRATKETSSWTPAMGGGSRSRFGPAKRIRRRRVTPSSRRSDAF
jgi:hypothetical protein